LSLSLIQEQDQQPIRARRDLATPLDGLCEGIFEGILSLDD
jgi:hypothetical protein